MNQTANQGAGVSFGSCPTPEKLAPDVDQRDREWAAWERDAFQVVVNQITGLLSSNYPGKGWFQIELSLPTSWTAGSPALIRNAFFSAYGDRLAGLIEGCLKVFAGNKWRANGKLCRDSVETLRFRFLPEGEKISLLESWGLISPVASVSVALDVNAIRVPPATVRPNRRGVTGHDTSGISVGATGGGAAANGTPFPYESLC